jgi:DNA-binding MarR family transcriptional regulator
MPKATHPKPEEEGALAPRLPVDSSLFFKLVRIVNLTARPFQEGVSKEHHLSLSEWRVMVVLASHAQIAATDVVDFSGMDKMSVSRAIAQLDKSERVIKSADPQDQRRTLLSLSPAGRKLYKKIGGAAMRREAHLFAGMASADVQQLDALLDRLLLALKAQE